jgi:hypothetical protein
MLVAALVAAAGCASITTSVSVRTAAGDEGAMAFVPVTVDVVESQIAIAFAPTPGPLGSDAPDTPRKAFSRRVAQSLQRAFLGKGPWTVIERVRADAIADEMVLQIGEELDERTRVEFGRRVAARIIVTAVATLTIDGVATLALDAIFVENGVIVWSATASAAVGETIAATFDELARAIADRLAAEIAT